MCTFGEPIECQLRIITTVQLEASMAMCSMIHWTMFGYERTGSLVK